MTTVTNVHPLISVIIPTYNYACFLPKAIESVLNQTYKRFEIIVIDDGSTDDTSAVAQQYKEVKYVHKQNAGLAAARNTGIMHSKGSYLVFLDADDWLEKDGLLQNLLVLKDKPDVAFVSGNHYFLRAATGIVYPVCADVKNCHYRHLLQSNYIGMHATVMFSRWVFDSIQYDEKLKACEDYDLYLRIARRYPILHHQHFIATYFFHSSGLSHNYQLMIDSITAVLQKQAPFIQGYEEQAAYSQGLEQWREYYDLMEKTA